MWIGLAALLVLATGVQAADLVADNAIVNDAKAHGIIGEQADGMLGVVTGRPGMGMSGTARIDPDGGTMGAVAELNEGRRNAYQRAAEKSGMAVQSEAEKAGEQNINQVPAGQYYSPQDGVWIKKK